MMPPNDNCWCHKDMDPEQWRELIAIGEHDPECVHNDNDDEATDQEQPESKGLNTMDHTVASATIPCLELKEALRLNSLEDDGGMREPVLVQREHIRKHGCVDGRIFLFGKEVRTECSCFKASYEGSLVITLITGGCGACFTAGGHCDGCAHCKGRYWTIETNTDVWRSALAAAGATVVRTWWNHIKKTWWADVRLVEAHLKGSVSEAGTPDRAFFMSVEKEVKKLPGVNL